MAYRWDGDQLIGQQQYYADGSAAREVQWVYEPGSFRPLTQVEAQGESTQLHYIVTDLTGTARELCSEEGEVRWRGEQGLWGGHREERRPIPLRRYLGDAANEEVYCELRYQGQLYDAETGLYYNRHRYYDAESGQYLSPDPIGLRGGLRPQGYVHNPLEWVDPFGLDKRDPSEKTQPDPYKGVKDASAYLREQGVPRNKRVEIINSFEKGTITVEKSGNDLHGIRFHDFGKNAQPNGQYLFESFTPQTNRSGLALPEEWNAMTGIKQWQVAPGTTILRGRAAPQLEYGS